MRRDGRWALLLLVVQPTPTASFHAATMVQRHRWPRSHARGARPVLCQQPANAPAPEGDGEDAAEPEERNDGPVIIPDKMPSFGLSQREILRLSSMFKRDEPLLQEILGCCMLLGLIGQRVSGLFGFLLGATYLGPFSSVIPGRVGNLFRIVGFHAFLCVAMACNVACRACSRASDLWLRYLESEGRTTQGPSGRPPLRLHGRVALGAAVRRRRRSTAARSRQSRSTRLVLRTNIANRREAF